MSDRSSIEWTEATWNPTTGCDRTSPGCDHCYTLTLARRLKAMGMTKYQNDHRTERRALVSDSPSTTTTFPPAAVDRAENRVRQLMSDLFHKRRAARLHSGRFRRHGRHAAAHLPGPHQALEATGADRRPLGLAANLWMGVSVEIDRYAFRVHHLTRRQFPPCASSQRTVLGPVPSWTCPSTASTGSSWVGESGTRHDQSHPEWARQLRDQRARRQASPSSSSSGVRGRLRRPRPSSP